MTPGTVTDETLLNEGTNNYLCAACFGKFGVGLGFADISTGAVHATFVPIEQKNLRLLNEIASFSPAEAVINVREEECAELVSFLRERSGTLVSAGAGRYFDYNRARTRSREVFGTDADKMTEAETVSNVNMVFFRLQGCF